MKHPSTADVYLEGSRHAAQYEAVDASIMRRVADMRGLIA